MANTIPCPNPVCPHDFTLAELQSAAQVQCPKCGFRMQGRGAAPAKPAAAPAVKPVPKPPVPAKPLAQPKPPLAQPIPAPATASAKVALATPVPAQSKAASPIAAAPLLAMPIPPPAPATAVAPGPAPAAAPAAGEESIAEGMFFNPEVAPATGTLVRGGQSKKKRNWMRIAIVALVLGFAASVVIVAFAVVIWGFLGSDGLRTIGASLEGNVIFGQFRNTKGDLEKVYKLVLPKKDWALDNEIKNNFKAHAAWKHNEYDFWFAVVVQDYGMLKPRDAEMLRIGIEKLEAQFDTSLELAAKAEPAKIGDLAVQKLQFKGQIKAANWIGECYMIFKDGIAYWLFIASPEPQTVEFFAGELPEKNFFIVSERRGWREQAPPTETFASASGKITVTVPKDVWAKHEAKNEDEKGDLFLFGTFSKKDRDKEKDNRKNASLLVFTLDKQEDPKAAMKTAREYLDKKVMGENTMYKIVHAADVAEGQTEIGTVGDVGNRRGRTIDLKLQFNDEPKRYYLLAVINEPDLAYAILCDCTWESRQIWRQDFLDVLRSLNVKKGD